jgi:hypothetical protein
MLSVFTGFGDIRATPDRVKNPEYKVEETKDPSLVAVDPGRRIEIDAPEEGLSSCGTHS